MVQRCGGVVVWWCGSVLLQWCDGVITWRDVVLHTDGRLVLCGEVLVHEAVQQTRLPDPVCGSASVSVLRSVWWTCVHIVWWLCAECRRGHAWEGVHVLVLGGCERRGCVSLGVRKGARRICGGNMRRRCGEDVREMRSESTDGKMCVEFAARRACGQGRGERQRGQRGQRGK